MQVSHVYRLVTLLLRAPARRRTTEIRGVATFYQAVAKILAFVRRSWVFDELPGGNHRRRRAGATRGDGAYGAYRCATSGGGG